jgi:SAM-dependent methyltransferase
MADVNDVRRAYDELAETYAAKRSAGGRGVAVLAGFMDSHDDSARVLDAGCGQGTPVLRRLDDETVAVGLAVSREQLRLAADHVPGAALVQGDLAALPVADGSVDAVVA